LLDAHGITLPELRRPVGTLSGGERQLVAVARALSRRPAVCLLDEPTAALSLTQTRTVEAVVGDLRAAGAAVVLVTHAPESATGLADRLVVLRRGRVVTTAAAGELHPDDLLALMAGADPETTARRQLSRLRETLDAAERSSRLAREFLSRLSHELRTPLTAIRGYATSLCATDVTFDEATTERFLANIASESDRLGRLVSDLLDATALDSGALRLQCDWCDVAATVRAALAAVPGGDTVAVVASPTLPVVWADHDRLCQVVVNLVENALRHTPEGTGVEVRLDRTGAGPATGDEVVELRVSDDGPGLSPGAADDLFLPWHRGAAGGERRRPGAGGGGAGLGLSIARGIVAAHGGTVTLEPAATGTTFLVRLPVEPAAGTGRAWEPLEADADA
ncbi:MAG TPA: ATP-binding protein, partial [Acidimicrobiia bacterium]|nr:ATP-binding protein [Acidimicrobiia bacterium]